MYSKRPALKAIDLGLRKVATTFGRAVYIVHSAKCNGTITVESDAEQLSAQMMAIDPSIRFFRPQPFVIDLIGGRLIRTVEALKDARKQHGNSEGSKFYTPDFEAEVMGLGLHALEVKVDGFTGDAEYEAKLGKASAILEFHGYRFKRVVVPRSRLDPLRVNIPLLFQAIKRKDTLPSPQRCTQILGALGSGSLLAKELFTKGLLQPNVLPVMLASGYIGSDLKSAYLDGQSLIRAADGDLSHLEITLGICA